MARVTIEDCLLYVDNRYGLVHLCTKRARQLFRGANSTVASKNGPVVTALREIALNRVRFIPEKPIAKKANSANSLTQ